MNKEQIIRRSQHITWGLAVCAGVLVSALIIGQHIVLSPIGEHWTLVGKLSGRSLAEIAPEELLATEGVVAVHDVRLQAADDAKGLLRLYIDDHLTKTLSAGETIHLALAKGQKLCADGELLEKTMTIVIQGEEQAQEQFIRIEVGAWQILDWEK